MNSQFKFASAITASLICLANVHAAKWEKIGPLYFDFDSIQRNGNIVTIDVQKSPIDRISAIYFDCAEKTANAHGWDKTLNFEAIPDLNKVALRVCKRTWEVWK